MGGIVAKLAITIAKNESNHYPGIGKAVAAVLFLGTPHHGSASARYATVLARIVNALVIGTQVSRFTGSMRTDLLKNLRRHEPGLLRVAEDFRVHTADFKIISFVEGKKMQALNTRVSTFYHQLLIVAFGCIILTSAWRLWMITALSSEPLQKERSLCWATTTKRCVDMDHLPIMDCGLS
jgi:hypothetical protein